jgi:hypothetical protein
VRDDELSHLVDEYLYLVEVGSGSQEADESELAHLLDRLALALRHTVAPAEPSPVPEIPARDFDVLHKVAASRFPRFGPYNRPRDWIRDVGRSDAVTADPTRDVAEIADHLHVVAWLWRRETWEAGLWYLQESHHRHWGEAMRCLQLYLQVREREHWQQGDV